MKIWLICCCLVVSSRAQGDFVSPTSIDGIPEDPRDKMEASLPLSPVDVLPLRKWDGKGADSFSGPFAKALGKLLASGLPDPKGLPYRKISIVTGSCYGINSLVDTKGWMLPPGKNGTLFAIAWNGLVYPVVKSDGDADFDKSVAELIRPGKRRFGPFGWDDGEGEEVLPSSVDLLHGLYLTRLGKVKAAEALLKRRDDPPKDFTPAVADDWAWNLYDRAVAAHSRGDAKLALASLRELERIKPSLIKLFPEPKDGEAGPLSWASQFNELKSECERRIKEHKLGRLDEKAFVATGPDVPTLIDTLDRIYVMQGGQPADVMLDESPVVTALVAKDGAAVEPLLKCLAEDTRMTQSVHFWRDFAHDRTVLGVHEAAIFALQGILHAEYFSLGSTGDSFTAHGDNGRKAAAAKIRTEWEKYHKATGPERSFQILSDNTATRSMWLFAADSLVFDRDKPARDERLEVLRERKNPSVSDLLEKRIVDSMTAKDEESAAATARCRLLICLLRWEPERGRAAIKRQTDDWIANDKWKTEIAALKSFIIEAAVDAPDVLRLFETMAWTLKPSEYDDFPTGETITSVFAKSADSPLMKRSREGLWEDIASPWCLAKLRQEDLESLIKGWVREELIKREPFRGELIKALGDNSQCATARISPDDHTYWTMNGEVSSPIPKDKTNFALKLGSSLPVRRKDVVANVLTDSWGHEKGEAEPQLEYWWPEKMRDERIKEVKKGLEASPPEPAVGK